MALPNLAAPADLSARGLGVVDGALVDIMLAAASTVIRSAAGSPIAEHEGTISMWATEHGEWLTIPVRPVTAVASVKIEGVAVADYKLVYGDLWRRAGWRRNGEPTAIELSLTAGLPEVPVDIVQLVCDLAILGIESAGDGAADPRVLIERIDDYSIHYAQGAESLSSALSVPAATRNSLAARFGGGVGSARMR